MTLALDITFAVLLVIMIGYAIVLNQFLPITTVFADNYKNIPAIGLYVKQIAIRHT